MKSIILVFLGGGFGSIGRYLLGLYLNTSKNHLPYGTFIANVVGSFLIGLLLAYFFESNNHQNARLFAVAGFCGGFTTMSTFSAESIQFLQTGKFTLFLIYLLITMIVCLSATALGFFIFKS